MNGSRSFGYTAAKPFKICFFFKKKRDFSDRLCRLRCLVLVTSSELQNLQTNRCESL
jgi:hypothetical protein